MSTKFSVNDTTATAQAYFLIRGMGYNALAKQIRQGESTVLSALASILKILARHEEQHEKMTAYNRVQYWLMRDAFNEVQAEQGVSYYERRYATPESREL